MSLRPVQILESALKHHKQRKACAIATGQQFRRVISLQKHDRKNMSYTDTGVDGFWKA
ncbi:uncharacterized protein BDZ99DRAFT_30485 [Mytilinidion resinicola]|uniref:Uncharacterized protein n=1 Tax=Mytilinidion resinicola TaxID=574789 RepID=A0A6A6YL57_9PEZI|nr:uncharacterized protein BDZ99DRAFT_30485 [Mytilinidion resinicola]KAF2809540.1 hypothetical protein BDZ99DRAFT_30485 [Mytilinidion resinicola]